ncbi:MAG: 2-C-methyl-D-erythritol 4-phosphate cytidylyltransferase [Flavobacteriales bacterium TMED191]|nr:MAG: 2-C-methyl-D-erythritol 4-phosphate cytidylyltransferase [Flavobacteriales bacterium TMED191]
MAHYVLILGGGQGTRMNNSTPKQFLEINDMPLLMHSISAFFASDPTCKIYIGLPKSNLSEWDGLCKKYGFNINSLIFEGGNKRLDTAYLGIKKIVSENECCTEDIISIHDGARPFIDKSFIQELINSARLNGSAIPVLPLKNALRRDSSQESLNNKNKSNSMNRSFYKTVQTPQVFNCNIIKSCYEKLHQLRSISGDSSYILNGIFDDASVYEKFKSPKDPSINQVPGREYNIKITSPMDYYLAPFIYDFYKSMQ